MKHIFVYLILISLLFLASSCPKNDNTTSSNTAPPEVLPPATQTGANTYGCLLNGKIWLPSIGGSGPFGVYGFIAQYYRGNFTLTATNTDDTTGITIHWQHTSLYQIGTYYFKTILTMGGGNAANFDGKASCEYQSTDKDSLNTYLTITKLDSNSRIISGTFNLLFNPSNYGCDTIRITNGRFDVKYTN